MEEGTGRERTVRLGGDVQDDGACRPNSTVQTRDAVRSPEFVNAWRAVVERPLSFDEFSALPMPQGYTPEELWKDFSILRRYAGITFNVKPWFPCDEDVSWASVTKQTERDLEEIAQLSAPGSFLDERLKQPSFTVGLTSFVAQEVSAACHRDGFEISVDDATAFLLRQCAPKTAEERAVRNVAHIWNHLDSYIERPLTIALLDRLHEDVAADVGDVGHLRQRMIYDESVLWTDRLSDRAFVEQMVGAAVSNAKDTGSMLDCARSFYELSAVLWDLKYFPHFNGLVELALRWVFFSRCGRFSLAFVPFTTLSRRRRNRYDRSFTGEFKLLTERVGMEAGLDCTLMFAGTVSTLLDGLRQIERAVNVLAEQTRSAMRELKMNVDLNWRQKEFLALLERNPRLSFKVKNYADLFNVVRVTARADLFDLVDKGYLNVRTVNRAAVFSRRI